MNFLLWWLQADALSKGLALLLMLMSLASWVVILWKARLLGRAQGDVARSSAAFWQAPSWEDARRTVSAFDRETLVLPLIVAAQPSAGDTLAAQGSRSQQLTRLLRNALQQVLHKLHYGQVLLASVGATAPFVGLLGTVWGIYHALLDLGASGQISVEKISGPVGESLIMTAAGLAVAIPAVLAYNVLGRRVAQIEAELEGFAFDLRGLLLDQIPASAVATQRPLPAQDSAIASGASAIGLATNVAG